jgi:hypothetical protein
MTYAIIEDCSPYYIRFTFPGLSDIIKYVKSQKPANSVDQSNYFHNNFDPEIGTTILKMLPMYNQFEWQTQRVAIFSTLPHKAVSIHKDGTATRISFNIPITVLDDKCITSWYADDSLKDYPIIGKPYTRSVFWDKSKYDSIPTLKQMTAKPNEMILFNTDIFHSWDNRLSDNIREVLTLRVENPHLMYFDQAKQTIFGNKTI